MNLFTEGFGKFIPLVEIVIISIIIIVLFNFIMLVIKTRLLKRAKNKSQVSTIKIFSRMVNIIIIWIIIIFAFLSYFKSWTGIGVVAGLLTAAVGFALQKPITGVAAWIMIAIKRPFQIGDRISIGAIKGDVYDISLTHVYIDEVGGTIDSEQHSGRNVLVPNYKLFDENLINHTLVHDYVLDEAVFIITYESDLAKAIALAQLAAQEVAGEHGKKINKEATTRVTMVNNGMQIKVLFFAPVYKLSQVKSEVYMKLYELINKEKSVNLAYNRLDIGTKK